MNHIVVFRLQFRAAVGEQKPDEAIKELDVAFGRLQHERIDARAVFADTIDSASVKLHDALVGAANVEDVSKTTIFLFMSDGEVSTHRLTRSRRTQNEHDADAIYVHVLEERCP